MSAQGRVLISIIPIALGACGLSVVGQAGPGSDGGLPDGASTIGVGVADGGLPGDAGSTPGDDASPSLPDASYAPVVLAPSGTIATPTGNAQQTHLVYAEVSRRWWLFTVDSAAPSELKAFSSTDFVTWSAAASLALPRPHGGHGANFSVAYATLGGQDIVHVAVGVVGPAASQRQHLHGRGVIAGDGIAWSATTVVSNVTDALLLDPDGCVTTITPTGRVHAMTGWSYYGGLGGGTGNANAYEGTSADNGGTWANELGARADIGVEQRTVNARAVVPLADDDLLTVWEGADAEPDPQLMRWSRRTGNSWSAPATLFATGVYGANDWSLAAVSTSDVHLVRRTVAGAFAHRRFSGTAWAVGDTIPALEGEVKKNTGALLLRDESRVILVVVSADSSNSLRSSTWSNGTWDAWRTIAAMPAVRSALSGARSSIGPAVIWTETSAGTTHVSGMLLRR